MNIANDDASLWNGDDPGWIVVRHTEDRERLQVEFSEDGPTTGEMKALRLEEGPRESEMLPLAP